MKVIHINEHLARKGGVETYLLALLPMLEDRAVTTYVAYGEGDPSLWHSGASLPEIGHVGFAKDASAAERTSELLRRVRPDVIHVHNIQSVGVLRACFEYGGVVMTAHDYRAICPANTFFYRRTQEVCGRACAGAACFSTTIVKHCLTPRPQYAAYFYHRARWTTARANEFSRVIAPSTGARDRLLRAGFNDDYVEVLPYFCPIRPSAAPRPIPERTTITFMGRIAPNKGHEVFVEALGLLPNEVQGVMVGNLQGDAKEHVRGLAERHGCADRIKLHSWASREQVSHILDETTVFVFPSLWPETLGIVGLEALARGVPVVASDIGGVREWLEDGHTGRLVEPKRPEQICEAVLYLTSSAERLEACGRAGIETIQSRFLPHQHVDRLIRLYERVTS